MKCTFIRALPTLSRGSFAGVSSSLLAGLLLTAPLAPAQAADTGLGAIKSYLVTKVTAMDKASHDYVAHAAAYEKIVRDNGGDYNRAALADGAAMLALIAKMQDDYRAIHNTGYETIEGITARTKRFVQFDNDLDAGVPEGEATTDSPASSLVLKTNTGKTVIDREGLFHYVMEAALWGTKKTFLEQVPPAAATKKLGGAKVNSILTRAELA